MSLHLNLLSNNADNIDIIRTVITLSNILAALDVSPMKLTTSTTSTASIDNYRGPSKTEAYMIDFIQSGILAFLSAT